MLMLSLKKPCIMFEVHISTRIISNAVLGKLYEHVGVTDVLNISNVAF
jgi:hypothetical protein